MDLSKALEELRSWLHDTPSQSLWQRIIQDLDAWVREGDLNEDDLCILISYIDEHMNALWPARLRWAPRTWWDRHRYGRFDTRWKLVRALAFRWETDAESIDQTRTLIRVRDLEHIVELDLSEACITSDAAQFLFRCPAFRNLKVLDLSKNTIGPFGWNALCSSVWGSALQTLDVRGNLLAGSGSILAQNERLREVRHLNLSNTQLTHADLQELCSSSLFEDLESLNIGYNPLLQDKSLQLLAESATLRNVRVLNVRGLRFGARGLRTLAHSEELKQLEVLDLCDNLLGPQGAKVIAEATSWANLHTLRMRGCRLGPRGGAALLDALWMAQLRTFSLTVHDVGYSAAKRLARAGHFAPHIRRQWPLY